MTERWLIEVEVDPAPDGDGPEFNAWCERYGFHTVASGRRAWCPQLSTYLRDAYGIATTSDGEQFLVYRDELHPADTGTFGTRPQTPDQA